MLFNSIDFLIFFPIVVVIYFIIPSKIRWIWLLISSYYFYMSWNPKYVILLATTTIITYLSGLLIDKANKINNEKKSIFFKKLWVSLSLLSNLGILFLFKYYNFFTSTFIRIFSLANISLNIPSFDYLLPVGISFYTFQALSYTIDVYRKDVKVEKNLGKYALFVSFFPTLLSGPIGKSKDLLHQFSEEHSFDYYRVKNGLVLMLWGLFQKLVISDRLAKLVNTVYDNPKNYKGIEILIATIFFTFQLYYDFSSYSDMARGAAEILGFKVPINFKSPYLSKSIKEFWRRWHISLSTWFSQYLYIPLGGSRCSKMRKYFNIMVVFLTSGLWHGAAINYIIWGGLHGIYQIIGDVLKPIKKRFIDTFKVKTHTFSFKLFQIITNFTLVSFAWIFFRANSFTDSRIIIKNIFSFTPWTLNLTELLG
ncbi:MBOAT family O-acyltransferase [Clostridium thermopalmarium]|uniref:MBOAT family O-acyltransferase n=1 Tax=Clostridium thermopalmarium TaxID=29373 RepID=UPI0023521F40|nr:MBOAT family O-acyltransferase [Clostridium thermopalmarium]